MHMIIKDVNTLVCRVIVLIIGVLEYWSNEINTAIQIVSPHTPEAGVY